MARKADNGVLHKAKGAKSDEFYTLLEDVERELGHYTTCFRNKTVYCNCDDYRVSNFYMYFKSNFIKLGLKRLVATSFQKEGDNIFSTDAINKGNIAEVVLINGVVSESIGLLEGNGDFRSDECKSIMLDSDIVVTNPPFSLFREFVNQIIRCNKQFLIIGNINAITYKEIFNLIKENKVWLGLNLGRGISGFIVPENYQLYGTEARIDEHGRRIVSTNNCLWLTNLPTPTRTTFIELSKVYQDNEDYYPYYDNFAGINVNKTQDIPCDYQGMMGVPITFLHKYNPEQFEIIKFRKGDDDRDLKVNGKCPYFRIIIRNRKPNNTSCINLQVRKQTSRMTTKPQVGTLSLFPGL